MSPLAELAIAVLLPTAAGCAILCLIRVSRRIAQRRYQPAPPEPLERLAARLQRLRAQLEATDAAQGLTAKKHRVTAARGAYLETLSAACRRLDVRPPAEGDRAALADIYRVEAALRERGVDVRESVPR